MKIDLTCPSELWRYTLPQEDSSACELTLYNLSDKLIVSMEVTLTLMNDAQEELSRVIYRAHDLHGLPEKPFTMTVPLEEQPAPASVEVLVEKIWFDDNSVWRRGKVPLSEYTSNVLPNSRSLEKLRYIAGKDAVGYPQEQNGLWLCVCGRPNANGSRICIRCHRNRTEVFANLTKEAVEKQTELRERQLALKGKQARENASRHQAQREKEYEALKRKRRRNTILSVTAAVLLAVAYGVVFHLLPYLQFWHAAELMEAGSYQEAIVAFTELGDYPGAQDSITRCTYLDAVAQLNVEEEASLAAAEETLLALGAYEDAADQALQARYLRAGVLLDAGRVEEARELYVDLADYEDSAAQVTHCDYLTAESLLATGEYTAARAAFEALGDYEDSAAKAQEAVYRPAKAALETGETAQAMAMLMEIPGYADADALMAQARYTEAVQLRQSGDLAAAGEAFRLVGDHEDAPQQANECFYQVADEAAQQGDHLKAAEYFALVPDYLDAQERWNTETYQLAVAALDDLEYALAFSLLDSLPADYEDAAALRLEARYRPAVTAYKKAEYQTALETFTALGDYKDSAEQALKSRYRLAEELRVAGDYAAALEHYAILGDYSDAADQLRLTRYQMGAAHLKAAEFAQAMTIFADLGDYRDSDDKLKEATYGNASHLLEAGDFDTAKAQFASLGKYSNAVQLALECDYRKAAALAAAGQQAEAAVLYLSLGDYQDAETQGKALYYALGIAAEGEGRVDDATAYYALIPGYEDADARTEAIHHAAFDAVRTAARNAFDAGDYPMTIAILQPVDMADLPKDYQDMPDLLAEACYQEASRLYAAGKPYEALPFYQMIPTYRNVPDVLDRSCYLILGQWLGAEGETFSFLPDGTCSLNGEKLYFEVNTYALQTGIAPDALSLTHKVSSISKDELTLRDIRDGQNIIIRLTRDKAFTLPEVTVKLPATPTPAPIATPAPTAIPEPAQTIEVTETPEALPTPEITPDPNDTFEVVDE